MSRASAALLLLILAAPALSRAAVSRGNQFVSANQQYSVELSRTPEDKVLVAVFDISKEPKALHWSRAIEWQPPHPFWTSPGSGVYEIKALVTSDGATVVLRDHYNTSGDKNGIRFLRRAE